MNSYVSTLLKEGPSRSDTQLPKKKTIREAVTHKGQNMWSASSLKVLKKANIMI